MRCQLIREQILKERRFEFPGTPRERAHLESCSACREWLDAERLLSASLSRMGRELAEELPGPRVEAALVAAFRVSRGGGEAARAAVAWRQRIWLWLPVPVAAAAALILIALQVPPAPIQPRETAVTTPTARMQTVTVEPKPPNRLPLRRAEGRARLPPRPRPTTTTPAPVAPGALQPSAPQEEIEGLGPLGPGIVVLADAPESTLDTPFVSLGPADTPVLLEGGQVLRVELSPERARSAGLPVDARSGPASIRADVVVGHDGVARAIRLVRDR